METKGKPTNAEADAVFESADDLQGVVTQTFFEHREQPGVERPVPYGDPEYLVQMPDGSTRKWKTLTAEEHEILVKFLELAGEHMERSAEFHERMAALIEESQQIRPGRTDS
jgi:hypothetical protein